MGIHGRQRRCAYLLLIFGEKRIVVRVAQSVQVLAFRLQLHQIDDIDHPDPQIGQMPTKNGNGGQNLLPESVSSGPKMRKLR